MIACQYCGQENEDTAARCRECGSAIALGEEPGQSEESSLNIFLLAIVLTVAFFMVCVILALTTHCYPLLLLLFPGMPIWGTIDAVRIRRKYFSDNSLWPSGDLAIVLQCSKPVIVAFLCVLWWPLGFAWYLTMRRWLRKRLNNLEKGVSNTSA